MLSLQDKKFDTYKDGIGHLCYVLDRNEFGIKENYLISKGYNRFIETDFSFYVHGGITPEENIIPLLKFERMQLSFVEPEVIIRGAEFRYSTNGTINLTIKNFNEYPLENVTITILNENIKWENKNLIVARIDKINQIDIALDKVRILKHHENNEKITIKTQFNYVGRTLEREFEFDIKIKAIQENKVNFDDLF